MACRGTPSPQQSSSSLGLDRPRRLGEHNTRALALTISFRATHSGPDARKAATLPHSHACPCSQAVRHLPRPDQVSRRTGQALSRRSIPCPRNAICCFGFVQSRSTMPACPPCSILFHLVSVTAQGYWRRTDGHGDGDSHASKPRTAAFNEDFAWVRFSCPCWDS